MPRIAPDEVIVIDSETSGINPANSRLCSFAAQKMKRQENGRWTMEECRKLTFDPGQPVEPGAGKVNGFFWSADGTLPDGSPMELVSGRPNRFHWTREGCYAAENGSFTQLKGMSQFADYGQRILNFIGDLPVIGHNAKFDIDFLDAELERMGLPMLSNEYGCTREAYAEDIGEGRDNRYARFTKLEDACASMKVSLDSRRAGHGALVDAQLCGECFALLEPRGLMLLKPCAGLPHRVAPVSLRHL